MRPCACLVPLLPLFHTSHYCRSPIHAPGFTHVFTPHWQGGSHPTVSKFATEVVKIFNEEGTRASLMEHFNLENPAILEIIGEATIADSELSAAIERNIPTVQTQAHILLPPSELPTVEIVEDSSSK